MATRQYSGPVNGRRYPLKTAAERRGQRLSGVRIPVPRVAAPPLPRSARPRDLTRYAQTNRIPAILILFGLITAVTWYREGHPPDRRRVAGLIVAAMIAVVGATLAPDFTALVVLAAFVAIALDQSDAIVGLIQSLTRLFGATAPASSTAAGPDHRTGLAPI